MVLVKHFRRERRCSAVVNTAEATLNGSVVGGGGRGKNLTDIRNKDPVSS